MSQFTKNEFDLTILGEVAALPILWDGRVEEYKETDRKPAMWQEIAIKMGSTPGMSIYVWIIHALMQLKTSCHIIKRRYARQPFSLAALHERMGVWPHFC